MKYSVDLSIDRSYFDMHVAETQIYRLASTLQPGLVISNRPIGLVNSFVGKREFSSWKASSLRATNTAHDTYRSFTISPFSLPLRDPSKKIGSVRFRRCNQE